MVALAALLAGALVSSSASAQCGAVCIYEVATPQMGSSYAGAVATAQDAATAYFNPAGMTRLEKGQLLTGFYAAFFDLTFESDRTGTIPPPGGFTNDGGNTGNFLPGMGSYFVVPIADELGDLEDLRFGLAVNGIFGGAADFDDDWIGRTYITDVELTVLNIQPSFALRVTDWLSLGVGVNIFYGQLGKFQLRALPTLNAPKLKADGADDWAPAATVGILLEPCEGTRIGAGYRSAVDMKLSGGEAHNFEFAFEFPQGFNIALFQELTENLTLLFDAGWSEWSTFGQQAVTLGPVDVSIDRRWRDTWRVAAGLQYAIGEDWLLQTGFSFDSSPVKARYRTPDMPYSENYRFSAGVQHDFSENLTAGLTYTFLWFGNPEIKNRALPPDVWGVVLDGKYGQSWGQFIGLNLRWSFCSPLPWVSCPSSSG